MQNNTPSEPGTGIPRWPRRFLEHRYLPAILALAAALLMLPALKTGFMADDLLQRLIALPPEQLPPRIQEIGISSGSGSLRTVLSDFFFAAYRDPERLAAAKKYGLLPWWMKDDARLGLWRPVTAFTHWVDYQLFPHQPIWMHAQNIAWFAAIAFLLTLVYRKLLGPAWAAGVAASLFVLDSNTCFPVMFIANRGFILSLFFGLICLYTHHQWRSTNSRAALGLSALFLALSLFANEGGASTFAFILAYALVLEPGPLRRRALTLLPSVLVIVGWRTLYEALGFGLQSLQLYIDPAHEPLQFAKAVIPRMFVLLGGQFTRVAPDLLFAVNPALQTRAVMLYAVPVLAVLILFLPWMRRDKNTVFWFAVMVFAAVPAATVAPLGKNLGFVAVGAYGMIAGFMAGIGTSRFPQSHAYRNLARAACVLLILAHVLGGVIGRVATFKAMPVAFGAIKYFIDVCNPPGAENRHVIFINAPAALALAYAPAYKAYYKQPLPMSIRTLVPGCTSFHVQRVDENTLVIQSNAPDIFQADDLGAFHLVYVLRAANTMLADPIIRKGIRYDLGNVKVEILESNASDLPRRAAFHFDASLDSSQFCWLEFDWQKWKFRPFAMPAVGQSVTLPGPGPTYRE